MAGLETSTVRLPSFVFSFVMIIIKVYVVAESEEG
jgi:hypothetical protein